MVFVLISSSWIPLYYINGAVMNAILSKVLKNIFKVPRPALANEGGYGMPSSHAQSLFYFVTILSCLGNKNISKDNRIYGYIGFVLTLAYAVIASTWRVVTHLHTYTQTIVGALLGICMGFIMHNLEVTNNISSVLNHPVPWSLRLFIIIFGAFVLYYRDFKELIDKKKT
jgi:dolichyldiphosphatase